MSRKPSLTGQNISSSLFESASATQPWPSRLVSCRYVLYIHGIAQQIHRAKERASIPIYSVQYSPLSPRSTCKTINPSAFKRKRKKAVWLVASTPTATTLSRLAPVDQSAFIPYKRVERLIHMYLLSSLSSIWSLVVAAWCVLPGVFVLYQSGKSCVLCRESGGIFRCRTYEEVIMRPKSQSIHDPSLDTSHRCVDLQSITYPLVISSLLLGITCWNSVSYHGIDIFCRYQKSSIWGVIDHNLTLVIGVELRGCEDRSLLLYGRLSNQTYQQFIFEISLIYLNRLTIPIGNEYQQDLSSIKGRRNSIITPSCKGNARFWK